MKEAWGQIARLRFSKTIRIHRVAGSEQDDIHHCKVIDCIIYEVLLKKWTGLVIIHDIINVQLFILTFRVYFLLSYVFFFFLAQQMSSPWRIRSHVFLLEEEQRGREMLWMWWKTPWSQLLWEKKMQKIRLWVGSRWKRIGCTGATLAKASSSCPRISLLFSRCRLKLCLCWNAHFPPKLISYWLLTEVLL